MGTRVLLARCKGFWQKTAVIDNRLILLTYGSFCQNEVADVYMM